MVIGLQHERLLDKNHALEEVVDCLVSSEPPRTCERAWWVMFYSTALRDSVASGLSDQRTLRGIKNNLWLAFNDAKVLLQPSVLNVQALVVMVIFAESVLSPMASWTLVSKACTMLLDLGVGKSSLALSPDLNLIQLQVHTPATPTPSSSDNATISSGGSPPWTKACRSSSPKHRSSSENSSDECLYPHWKTSCLLVHATPQTGCRSSSKHITSSKWRYSHASR